MNARVRRRQRSGSKAGYVLVELMLAMTVTALLAALALPLIAPQGGSAGLRAKSAEVTALLRTIRNTALTTGRAQSVEIADEGRTIRSAAGTIALPGPLSVNLRTAERSLRFLPDGRSTGGAILLSNGRATSLITINPRTASIGSAVR